jgi:flagellar biosynthetic protein FlhB
MADSSKTERATEKKRRDERKKGNIFHSRDVVNAFGFALMVFALQLAAPLILSYSKNMMTSRLLMLRGADSLSVTSAGNIIKDLFISFLLLVAPVGLLAAACAVILTGVQTRFLFSMAKLKPQLARLNPANGFKRLFSLRSAVELLKALIKVTIIGSVVYSNLKELLTDVAKTPTMALTDVIGFLARSVYDIAMGIAIYIALFAIADYLYQWWEYEREIRMTKQELKEELKQTEGDPQIKARVRDVQRKMAAMRMMRRVPDADVVIRNPTHYAVALKYTPGEDDAPIVVAKGQDYTALKIIEVAKKHDIHITENKPLARGLYEGAEIGMPIPEEFYKPVADILAYIYRLRKSKNSRTG